MKPETREKFHNASVNIGALCFLFSILNALLMFFFMALNLAVDWPPEWVVMAQIVLIVGLLQLLVWSACIEWLFGPCREETGDKEHIGP